MEKEKRDLVLAVAGLGYVGLSLAVLLSQHHKVYAVDVDPRRVEELAQGHSPISDRELEHYLKIGRSSFRQHWMRGRPMNRLML